LRENCRLVPGICQTKFAYSFRQNLHISDKCPRKFWQNLIKNEEIFRDTFHCFMWCLLLFVWCCLRKMSEEKWWKMIRLLVFRMGISSCEKVETLTFPSWTSIYCNGCTVRNSQQLAECAKCI
jgi:hypothetical protein